MEVWDTKNDKIFHMKYGLKLQIRECVSLVWPISFLINMLPLLLKDVRVLFLFIVLTVTNVSTFCGGGGGGNKY